MKDIRNKPLICVFVFTYVVHYALKHNYEAYSGWPSNYLGDLLCMPITLLLSLLIMRILTNNALYVLTPLQIWGATILISWYFEWFFPTVMHRGVSDPWDVFYYALGTLLFIGFFGPRKRMA